uniref:Entry exclusion protein 1 n=1 Tax=Pseudomonas sp. GLE121 TaxID=1329969 RepID=R4L3X7_9PSED|nr:entry exclusion protein 1 [Pseudomonas sp. GLE121]AGL12840.1 entry exclusion protein 1 [Pseudomonas sp. GLE121]
MAWHTIQEAQKLTGKSRRTLYRDMSTGRLSWVPEGENARRLETSELIRAYGALLPVAQPESEKKAHSDTGLGTADTTLILAELKALREEVAELRQAMRLIEHKPDMAQDTAQQAETVEPLVAPPDEAQPVELSSVPDKAPGHWWSSIFKPFKPN